MSSARRRHSTSASAPHPAADTGTSASVASFPPYEVPHGSSHARHTSPGNELRRRRSSGAGSAAGGGAGALTSSSAHIKRRRDTSIDPPRSRRRFRICMVSDFFFPGLGGVEMHIYQLSQCLRRSGHKVIVFTHAYGERTGIRYLNCGIKVYYCPFKPMFDGAILPTFFATLPLFRNVCIRERIEIVHGHQESSTLTNECLLHAAAMGLHTVFTDHSLFGFTAPGAIHINKVIKFSLCNVSHCICVSHTSRENTVLRSRVNPRDVSVIPNALDATQFTPDVRRRDPSRVRVVVLSRLVYRKGVDLLVDVIPAICRRHNHVDFIIGGDGDKRILIEEMREKYQLHERVELCGAVQHNQVRNVLNRGDVFLNCSLTEAFCIAILEAAACGLLVVSTAVGGVPEVLPSHMIRLSAPNAEDLIEAVDEVIGRAKKTAPMAIHEEIKSMYTWHEVSERTEAVYRLVSSKPPLPLLERMKRYYASGPWAGKLNCLIGALHLLLLHLLVYLYPEADVDLAPDLPFDLGWKL